MIPFTFRAVEELELGPKWQAVFEEKWPHYKTWFLREGEAARPSYATSVRMLRAHMPELVPAYEQVVELAGGGDLAARMLSLYKPPPYLAACSQGVWTREGGPDARAQLRLRAVAVRGAHLVDPAAREAGVGMTDCLWGLLDGMNDDGLAVSLTFGGRRVLGDGFGIPIVMRYLLGDLQHDRGRSGHARPAPVFAEPQPDAGRRGPARCSRRTCRPIASRSSGRSRRRRTTRASWSGPSRRARRGRSSASRRSSGCSTTRPSTRTAFVDSFLRAPLFSTSYAHGFGTLYTAAYRAAEGAARYIWPAKVWELGFDSFVEGEHTEVLAEPTFATSAG